MNDSVLKQLGAAMAEQEQLSGLMCPFCNGGGSLERTLSMKRNGNQISYICHRDGCKKKGFFLVVGPAPLPATKAAKFSKALKDLKELPAGVKDMLAAKYHMNTTDLVRIEAKWQPDMRRVCFPILSPERNLVGYTMRSYEKDVKPKSYKAITNFALPALSYYRCWATGFDKLLIVEDQVSACRAANTASAVALCGTNINLTMVRHMKNLFPKRVVICLDADAFGTAIKIQERWGGMFEKCKVVKPPKDLKDMERDQLRSFINAAFGE